MAARITQAWSAPERPVTEAIEAAPRGPTPGRRWRAILPLSVGALVLVLPRPDGLTPEAWRYFAVFLAVIVSGVVSVVTLELPYQLLLYR